MSIRPKKLTHCSVLTKGTQAILRVEKAKALIDSDPSRDWKTVRLAELFGVCRHYLGRTFKSVAGVTVNVYAYQKKVHLAQELFRNEPQRAPKDIAMACGFRTEPHFSRIFHEISGETPGQFRLRANSPGGGASSRMHRTNRQRIAPLLSRTERSRVSFG